MDEKPIFKLLSLHKATHQLLEIRASYGAKLQQGNQGSSFDHAQNVVVYQNCRKM